MWRSSTSRSTSRFHTWSALVIATGAGLILVLSVPSRVSAQAADPQARFVDSLQRFGATPDKTSLDALARSLADWDAAVRSSEAQFAASLPGSSPAVAARLHVSLGAIYLNRRRVQDALREFDAGSHLDSTRADVFTLQGAAYEQLLGDFDRAAAAYRQAAALDPLNVSLAYLVAHALDRAGRRDQAREAYQSVLRLWRRDVGEHASIAVDAPFIQLALVDDRAGVEPFFPPPQYVDGFALIRKGDYAAAISSFTKAIDAPSANGDAPGTSHYRLARSYQRQNRTVEALAEYEAAEALRPLVGEGRLLQTIGALKAAEQDFDAALQADAKRVDVNVNDADAHRTLGYLYSRLERHDEAFAEFAIALTIAPNTPDVLVAMSQLSLKDGDYASAADAARRAIALDAANKQAHYSLATALMRLDRAEEAKPEFAAFERLQANDTAAAAREMTVNGLRRQAAASLEAHDYDGAVAALRKALELAPGNADVRADLAEAESLRRK